MKTKLFLILTILIFAYSCNSPSNPTKASNNQSNISNSIENNAMHDIAKLNSNAAKIGEPNIEDNYKPLAVYEGNGKYRINGVDFPNDENLKIEIYDDGSIDVIRTKKYFRFERIDKSEKDIYKGEEYYNGYRHTLDMTVIGDKAKVIYTIQGDNKNYYFESESLVKVIE